MAALGAGSQHLRRLRRLSTDRAARDDERCFVLEGPTTVADALESPVVVEAVFVDPTVDARLVARATAAGATIFEVDARALAKATDAVTSQGVAAIAKQPIPAPSDIPPGSPLLVLVEIADPGNAGTLLRSAEAAGFGGVRFTSRSVDPFSPKAVRASAGSVLRVPVLNGGEADDVLDEVAASGRLRVGTVASGGEPLHHADLPPDTAFVLGNEAHGLPAAVVPSIDRWVTIPMAGRAESLNVAMAGTVLCFELARRRQP